MIAATRRTFLALACAATVIAAWLAPPPADSENVILTSRAQSKNQIFPPDLGTKKRPTGIQQSGSQRLLTIRSRDGPEEGDWSPPSAAAALPQPPSTPVVSQPERPPPPPPPQAPALPFRLLGRYVDDANDAVFLQLNGRDLVVRMGDVVDNLYRVEGIDARTIKFRYLPLDQQQSLDLGILK